MATERKSPDAILELVNLIGTVSEIQDDPDTPDANWLDAVATNLDTAVRVSFPTPTGNPTVGVGLQEFRALVRPTGTAKVPSARIELWENGGLIRAGSGVSISVATVISFTWNANEISTPDGSLVECYIYGTKNATVAVEVGAVEWNVVYSAGVVVTPGTASLVTALYTPVVTASDNKTVTPGLVSLTTTLFIPVVTASDNKTVTPGVATLTTTLYIPAVTVSNNIIVTPGTLALVITLYMPTVTVGTGGTTVTPGTASLIITRYIPVITATANIIITPGTLSLVATRFTPSVSNGTIVIPGTIASTLTKFIPTITISQNVLVVPGLAIWSMTAYIPLILLHTTYGSPFLWTVANWGSVSVFLEIYLRATSGTVYARLIDSNNSLVTNSEVSTNETTFQRLRSSALTLTNNLTYRVQFGKADSDAGEFLGARLIIIPV